jgi:hypothetical protein
VQSLILGEAVAIAILRDQRRELQRALRRS